MHRVVTKRIDHRGKRIVELGPWHLSRSDAENWATILREQGYHAEVESMGGGSRVGSDDDDLMQALSNMA